MGFLSKLKEKTSGIVTSVKSESGVAPIPADELERKLLEISSDGTSTEKDGDEVVICWAAKVSGIGPTGAGSEYRYRAIRVELDGSSNTAKGICYKTDSDAELDLGGLSVSKSWERGQHVGSEKMHVIAWIGLNRTEGAADRHGYQFSWSALRDPVIKTVTESGWTYKPKVK